MRRQVSGIILQIFLSGKRAIFLVVIRRSGGRTGGP